MYLLNIMKCVSLYIIFRTPSPSFSLTLSSPPEGCCVSVGVVWWRQRQRRTHTVTADDDNQSEIFKLWSKCRGGEVGEPICRPVENPVLHLFCITHTTRSALQMLYSWLSAAPPPDQQSCYIWSPPLRVQHQTCRALGERTGVVL